MQGGAGVHNAQSISNHSHYHHHHHQQHHHHEKKSTLAISSKQISPPNGLMDPPENWPIQDSFVKAISVASTQPPFQSIVIPGCGSHVITPLMITIRLWGPSQGGQDWLTQMPGLAIGGDCAQPTIDCRLHLITRIIIRPRARSQQLRNIAGSCNIC